MIKLTADLDRALVPRISRLTEGDVIWITTCHAIGPRHLRLAQIPTTQRIKHSCIATRPCSLGTKSAEAWFFKGHWVFFHGSPFGERTDWRTYLRASPSPTHQAIPLAFTWCGSCRGRCGQLWTGDAGQELASLVHAVGEQMPGLIAL